MKVKEILFFLVLCVVGLIALFKYDNYRKETCIKNNGLIKTTGIGTFDSCIYGRK